MRSEEKFQNLRESIRDIIFEWYDDSYFEKKKKIHGKSNFKDIDWVVLFKDILIPNTELLKSDDLNKRKKAMSDGRALHANDLIDEEVLTKDDIDRLEHFGLIYLFDSFPIIDDSKYLDYDAFINKAKEIWDKDIVVHNEPSQNYEIPYLRGREEQAD